MVEVGQQLVEQNGGSLGDCRFGFHWPPFNSIKHLHLHVIFPESGMSFIGRQIYRPGTFYFATVNKNEFDIYCSDGRNFSFYVLFQPEVTVDWILRNRTASL